MSLIVAVEGLDRAVKALERLRDECSVVSPIMES